eukprot:gnl/MRDRNA2_/MRDRNA2_155666_c0_seq1.p1 gnl/MRDRNA2_/MRDRNA2_155666_c0~~gnl/MRDRNA2_/MRDRNA2_155666_c0_seq1.p1  ORF type:complete len:781 (-),score=104.61 gnl/MRDRNA2_/MRDRNA2_155666_c0_seq1:72-2414(-)
MAEMKVFPVVPPEPDGYPETSEELKQEHRFSWSHERTETPIEMLSPDIDRSVTKFETLMYYLENYAASSPSAKFVILGVVAAVMTIALSFFWLIAWKDEDENADYDYAKALYMVFQAVAAGGVDDSLTVGIQQFIFLASILTGLLVFAVLVGFVNDLVAGKMESLNEGSTKVAISGHTLILGWNEGTARAVCQIAFLRRTYLMQNETWQRRLFPWTRVKPSTPLAANPVVVMCDTMEKAEMDSILQQTLAKRGISPKRTRVGWDVVCRIGDPTDPHDLLRVGAHRASRVLTMMTEKDIEEEENSEGVIQCGATLRTLLALRSIILDPREEHTRNPSHPFWETFRCVTQVDQITTSVDVAKFRSPAGHELVRCVDLSRFVNSLMFNCTVYPSLAHVFIEMLSFEGTSFRARMASEIGLVGKKVGDCANFFQDAVVVGVLNTRKTLSPTMADPNEGMAGSKDRLITADDRILFVAGTTSPTPALPLEVQPLAQSVVFPSKMPFGIMVCGWRKVWHDGSRLVGRIRGMVHKLAPGSKIFFLNMIGSETFTELLEADGSFSRKAENAWMYQGINVLYREGDPADFDTLRDVMAVTEDCKFEVAIMVGTMAQYNLPPNSRDLRVLSTMMLLRKAHADLFGEAEKFHVVGENCLDSTADLALQPIGDRCSKDFVNTQAIMARSLVLALAYPVIQPAVAQLCQVGPGLPDILVSEAGKQLIPLGPASFAQVTRAVAEKNSVCVGYMCKDGKMVLAPSPSSIHDYEEGDLLIIISRDPFFVATVEADP